MLVLATVEAVYTFVDSATGEPTHIASGMLLQAVKRAGVIPLQADIAPSLAAALEAGTLGVEEPHALSLPEAALEAPVLVCEWGDSHVIADGAHRLWRRWRRGDTDFPAYVIPERAWRLFVIPNEEIGGDGAFWDNFNRNAKVRT